MTHIHRHVAWRSRNTHIRVHSHTHSMTIELFHVRRRLPTHTYTRTASQLFKRTNRTAFGRHRR